jgi:hypothetical protein
LLNAAPHPRGQHAAPNVEIVDVEAERNVAVVMKLQKKGVGPMMGLCVGIVKAEAVRDVVVVMPAEQEVVVMPAEQEVVVMTAAQEEVQMGTEEESTEKEVAVIEAKRVGAMEEEGVVDAGSRRETVNSDDRGVEGEVAEEQSETEQEVGKSAVVEGCAGITEGQTSEAVHIRAGDGLESG